MKIVINRCYGGFSLSAAAIAWLKERGIETSTYPDDSTLPRNHSLLVECVETLGDAANGDCAALIVVEVPDDVGANWHIAEYDGNEHVAEDHRTWG